MAARYRGCGRFAFHYVNGKLRRDPLTAALLELGRTAPFGSVADLGCGRGQFAALLLEAGLADRVFGLDVRAELLGDARRAMQDLAFVGLVQDLAADVAVPACDTVLLLDVLYQLPGEAPPRLLHAAAAAARRRVLVRTPDAAARWRAAITTALEQTGRRLWPHAGAAVNPPPVASVAQSLRDAGFAVTMTPCWAGTPFANVLLVADRCSLA